MNVRGLESKSGQSRMRVRMHVPLNSELLLLWLWPGRRSAQHLACRSSSLASLASSRDIAAVF